MIVSGITCFIILCSLLKKLPFNLFIAEIVSHNKYIQYRVFGPKSNFLLVCAKLTLYSTIRLLD